MKNVDFDRNLEISSHNVYPNYSSKSRILLMLLLSREIRYSATVKSRIECVKNRKTASERLRKLRLRMEIARAFPGREAPVKHDRIQIGTNQLDSFEASI